ncbi:TrmH family RNA methyltransferase [Kytococcus sp. Marseille-QA3725]
MARPPLHLTSAANPRIKALRDLRRRRVREQTGSTVVEGFEELELALAGGVHPRELFLCEELMADPAAQQPVVDLAVERGASVVTTTRAVFEKAAYREGPDGFLAVVPSPGLALADLQSPDGPALWVVAEHLEKPGNLGAILRTADAAGVDAVIAADPVTDWGNPNVVRASKGTVFSVPVASASRAEVQELLAARGISLVSTTPHTDLLHTDADYGGPVAIAVGAEKTGLTDELLAASDQRVRIPMVGRANSLNVATSAAIVVYEAVRQRS